jgi:hypothetical protein
MIACDPRSRRSFESATVGGMKAHFERSCGSIGSKAEVLWSAGKGSAQRRTTSTAFDQLLAESKFLRYELLHISNTADFDRWRCTARISRSQSIRKSTSRRAALSFDENAEVLQEISLSMSHSLIVIEPTANEQMNLQGAADD